MIPARLINTVGPLTLSLSRKGRGHSSRRISVQSSPLPLRVRDRERGSHAPSTARRSTQA